MSPTATTAQQYNWEALDTDGKKQTGVARADDKGAVESRLISQNLTPLSVKAVGGGGITGEINFRKTPKHKAMVSTFRQFATMQQANLSTVESLQILSEQTDDIPLKTALVAVLKDAKTGVALSVSMAKHDRVFPLMITNMIKAGEAGGFLDKAMLRIAEALETEAELRSKIKKAMTYPMAVFALAMVIVTFMVMFIVPMFAKMFNDLGGPDAKLPLPTLLLVSLSKNMAWILPVTLISLFGFSMWWGKNHNKTSFREKWDPIKIKLPVFGKLFHQMSLTRFALNLAQLINSGVHLPEALSITASTAGNIRMERAIMASRDSVLKGHSLAEPLADEPLFGNMVVKMVTVGERSGDISGMLNNVGNSHRRNVDEITNKLQALIEPLFMAFLAVVVGFIVIAMYMPYLGLTALIK